MTRVSPQIELLLSTVNDAIVSPPMGSDQVADEVWQKCLESSAMISEMPWQEIKRSTCPCWQVPITMETRYIMLSFGFWTDDKTFKDISLELEKLGLISLNNFLMF